MSSIQTSIGDSSADLVPRFAFLFEWPEDISDRRHNQIAKAAMRETLRRYHDDNRAFPRKFTRAGRKLYGYKPRSHKYERYKQKRYGNGSIDMVKRGRTRQWMLSAYRLTVGGTASAGSLNATLKLTFPFEGGSGRFKNGTPTKGARGSITILQLIQEMQRFADDEPRLMAQWFHEEYMRQVDQFRSNRKRVRTRR